MGEYQDMTENRNLDQMSGRVSGDAGGTGLDPLTGLMQMHAFVDTMGEWRKRARNAETDGELVVLYLDLVQFRMINIRYGLALGDAFLREVGRVLSDVFPDGVVAHLEGDHFAVLTDTRHLDEKIDEARERIQKASPSRTECSIGACVWDDYALKPETVCSRARMASDENRRRVRTYFSYYTYTPEIGNRMETAAYVVSHVDEAIQKGWIVVYYQPIVRALSNQICGMEALARWQDPERGLLPPVAFIGPLEEAQQIWKLDLCVIRQVICEIAERSRRGVPEIPVSINLSRMDFFSCDIFREIEALVQQYDVPRRMLHIEVTESIMTSSEHAILQALDEFRGAGYEIWMDDFGSGYSTLNLLKDYTFDLLKMDMAFLRNDSKRSRDIIASVIHMDKKIGIRTLAEGVETEEQAEFLKKSGCEKLQGYLFGKPMPFDEMLKNSIGRGLGIESAKQKVCYDALGHVNFMTDIPLAIVEYRDGAFHILFMNDPALQLIHRDGFSDLQELEHNVNDSNNVASRELLKVGRYAVQFGTDGEVNTPFKGKERLLQYRLLGSYDNNHLFAVRIYDRTPAEGMQSSKSQLLMNILYFYRYVYSMDLGNMTIQSLRFTKASKEQSHAVPIRDDAGHYSALLPAVFLADQKRYDAFLRPETLKSRLEQAEYGMVQGVFRTRNASGRFVWMSHKILLVPNADGKQLLYVISMTDVKGASMIQEGLGDSYDALTDAPTASRRSNSAEQKAELWDDLMLHIPLPLFWKDSDRRFLGASRSFLDYYGFASLGEILGKNDEDMGWHPNNEPYQVDEKQVMSSGTTHHNVPGRCIAKGVSRDIFATKWPTYHDGRISGLMGYFLDKAFLPGEQKDAGHILSPDMAAGLRTASQFMDDLVAYESDYQLNQKDFGIVSVWIPELLRISSNYGHSAMYAVVRACSHVIAEAVGHAGSSAYVGVGQIVVVTPYVSTEEIQEKAQRIREGIDAIRQVEGVPCSLYAKVRVIYTEEAAKLRSKVMEPLYHIEKTGDETEADRGASRADENRMLKTLMDAMPVGCYILRPDHTVLYWNHEAERLLGFSASEMQGKRCVDMPLGCSFTSGAHIPGSHCPAIIAMATGQSKSMEMFMRQKNGKDLLIRNTLVPLKDSNGKVNELVAFFTPLTADIYDQGVVQTIYETATRDPLTCLPGRKFMEVCLEEAMEIYQRTDQPFAVLFADVNNFHDINNVYGHAAGDDLLRKFGIALRKNGRKADKFCRWGGDEFVGLLHLRQAEDIKGAAKRFLELAHKCEIEEQGQKICCRASIGITVVREGDTIRSLVARADRYMYQAKKRQGDQLVTDYNADEAGQD